jgi:hypothetical protein
MVSSGQIVTAILGRLQPVLAVTRNGSWSSL